MPVAGEQRREFSRQELYNIALYQKAILFCILCYVLTLIGLFMVPKENRLLAQLPLFAISVVATVFLFLLAIKVYNVWVGIVLGLLTLVPCMGLIVLVAVNGKATGILQRRGYKVGLLGLSQFKQSNQD